MVIETSLDPQRFYKISRFAVIHPAGESFLIETPFSDDTVRLDNSDIFALLLAFVRGVRLSDLLTELSDSACESVLKILEHCYRLKLLIGLRDGIPDDESGSLRAWEAHDLFFHTRSRLGRHRNPSGATYRFGQGKSETNMSSLPRLCRVSLRKPDLNLLEKEDPPFTRVLEGRASFRSWSDEPLALDTLGDFLFRSARAKWDRSKQCSTRVYPSAGGLYPLHIYLVVNNCESLGRGIYKYNDRLHCLDQLAPFNEDIGQLLDEARMAAGTDTCPPILIHLAACFEKINRKYSSIAYALILKEVGCLLQTFYLVATAMGLAPCALGNGNSDRFSKVIGSDYYRETTVGELMLGLRP